MPNARLNLRYLVVINLPGLKQPTTLNVIAIGSDGFFLYTVIIIFLIGKLGRSTVLSFGKSCNNKKSCYKICIVFIMHECQ